MFPEGICTVVVLQAEDLAAKEWESFGKMWKNSLGMHDLTSQQETCQFVAFPDVCGHTQNMSTA